MIRRAGYDSNWVTKGCLLRCDNGDPPDTTGHGSAAAADREERSCPIHKGSRKNQPPITTVRFVKWGWGRVEYGRRVGVSFLADCGLGGGGFPCGHTLTYAHSMLLAWWGGARRLVMGEVPKAS